MSYPDTDEYSSGSYAAYARATVSKPSAPKYIKFDEYRGLGECVDANGNFPNRCLTGWAQAGTCLYRRNILFYW